MKTLMTKDQLIVKLIDFHSKRLKRIDHKNHDLKIKGFQESYNKMSKNKLLKEYNETFFDGLDKNSDDYDYWRARQ